MYLPEKYFKGLSARKRTQRKKEIQRRSKKHWKDPTAYLPFQTDIGVKKTRKSSYTSRFHTKYPGVKSLPEISKATGISLRALQEVYNRGLAAWRTGHRPGATQQQWGYARVHSFVLRGKTFRGPDSDIAKRENIH
jgi:Family of unknown function (DUF5824)